jgi:glycosyltransferase involved in cell wall biosynthesis
VHELSLPRITIVTPSFNHGHFLEETICSVLDQRYPELEYIIVDGGSTDNSVSIIEKYAKHLSWWVSEKDSGQSHALNKGFARAAGDIANWLCSDDCLKPDSLKRVGELFLQEPALDVVSGKTEMVYQGTVGVNRIDGAAQSDLADIPVSNPVRQPSCFFRRRLLRSQALREDLHYTMDLELWASFIEQGVNWRCIDDVLSMSRYTPTNKTNVGGRASWLEYGAIYGSYGGDALWGLTNSLLWPVTMLRRSLGPRFSGRLVGAVEWRLIGPAMRWWYGDRFYKLSETLHMLATQEAAKVADRWA